MVHIQSWSRYGDEIDDMMVVAVSDQCFAKSLVATGRGYVLYKGKRELFVVVVVVLVNPVCRYVEPGKENKER